METVLWSSATVVEFLVMGKKLLLQVAIVLILAAVLTWYAVWQKGTNYFASVVFIWAVAFFAALAIIGRCFLLRWDWSSHEVDENICPCCGANIQDNPQRKAKYKRFRVSKKAGAAFFIILLILALLVGKLLDDTLAYLLVMFAVVVNGVFENLLTDPPKRQV